MKTWYIAALVIIGLIVAGIAYSMYESADIRRPTYNTSYGEKRGKPVYGPTRRTWKKADWGDVKVHNFDDL
jgi:hypothetical protein